MALTKNKSSDRLKQAGHYANLPGTNALWHFAISIEESQSQLDDLQEVHIASQELQKDENLKNEQTPSGLSQIRVDVENSLYLILIV